MSGFDNTVNVVSGSDCEIPKSELDGRMRRVQALIAERDINVLLVTSPEDIFYLSGQQTLGYYTFQCLLVPRTGSPVLMIVELEAPNAKASTYVADIVALPYGSEPETVADAIERRGWSKSRIAIQRASWFLSVEVYDRIVSRVGKVIDGSDIVSRLRLIKSKFEIEQLEKAGAAADAGIRAAIPFVRVGCSESDIAAAANEAIFKAGSEWVAMGPIITSGPRSGLRHSTWKRRKLVAGDPVVLELAAAVNRYHVANYRMACVSPVPDKVRRFHDVVHAGFEAAAQQMKPGNLCSDPFDAARAVIEKAGLLDHFRRRSAGYSMGVAFAPNWGEIEVGSLGPGNSTVLSPGMVFHIPITLCDYGRFTCGMSETLLITEKGHKSLSSLERVMFQAQ